MTTTTTPYKHDVILCAPVDQSKNLATSLASSLARDTDDFLLRATYGASSAGPITHQVGSGSFTDFELGIIRAALSVGGVLYLLGCRARRLMNDVVETTTHEPGKLQVVVYDAGDTLPAELDWTTARVTKAFFLAEFSPALTTVQPAL